MKNKILIGLTSLAILSSTAALADKPNFVLLPNIKTNQMMTLNAIQAVSIETKAIELVKSALNITTASPYSTIRIRLVYNTQNQVDALIVYLLSSTTKSAELIRINLTPEFTVTSIEKNYHLKPEDVVQSPDMLVQRKPQCPDETVQFVIGNNFGADSSIENEVHKVYELAKEKGYNPFLMDTAHPNGPQPSVQAYQDWMSCPALKGFYNESHGFEEGIVLPDGDFLYSHVEGNLKKKLDHEVILFDSCETFHPPLLPAMTKAKKGNAQQYVAGIISLPFGASERTASCFWAAAFNHAELTKNLVEDCERQNDLQIPGYGITGNGEKYLTPASAISIS